SRACGVPRRPTGRPGRRRRPRSCAAAWPAAAVPGGPGGARGRGGAPRTDWCRSWRCPFVRPGRPPAAADPVEAHGEGAVVGDLGVVVVEGEDLVDPLDAVFERR